MKPSSSNSNTLEKCLYTLCHLIFNKQKRDENNYLTTVYTNKVFKCFIWCKQEWLKEFKCHTWQSWRTQPLLWPSWAPLRAPELAAEVENELPVETWSLRGESRAHCWVESSYLETRIIPRYYIFLDLFNTKGEEAMKLNYNLRSKLICLR